jgi:hypothetical protein
MARTVPARNVGPDKPHAKEHLVLRTKTIVIAGAGIATAAGLAPRADEQLLTGESADRVSAAAKAKEPDATVERVETDSDGVYEAHMVRADGTRIIVQVGADFQVTNVIEGGAGHGKGGQKAPAGAAPGGEAPSASGSASSS